MPVLTCTSRALEETVAALEAKGDRIQSVAVSGDTIIVAYYTARPAKGRETR